MFVYWIHTAEMTDLNEGYIGVGKNPAKRFRSHVKKGRFCGHCKKDELLQSIIFEGSEEECFAKEFELRPTERIGWNIAPGGEGGFRGNHWSERMEMTWRDKINETIRDSFKTGKREVWNKGKKGVQQGWLKGLHVATKPRGTYIIKDCLTGQLHECIGIAGVQELTGAPYSTAGTCIRGNMIYSRYIGVR